MLYFLLFLFCSTKLLFWRVIYLVYAVFLLFLISVLQKSAICSVYVVFSIILDLCSAKATVLIDDTL